MLLHQSLLEVLQFQGIYLIAVAPETLLLLLVHEVGTEILVPFGRGLLLEGRLSYAERSVVKKIQVVHVNSRGALFLRISLLYFFETMCKLAADPFLLQILGRNFDGDDIGCAFSLLARTHINLSDRNIFNQQLKANQLVTSQAFDWQVSSLRFSGVSAIMGENYTSYKNYIRCLGNLCGTCCCNYKRIETSTIGLIEEFGKFKELLEPGLHYYNPCTESIRAVELRTKVMDMRNQIIYTKDNISVDIDTTLFYRVIDPYKSIYVVKDITRSLAEMTFVTMRTVCGEYTLQDLLIKRVEVNDKISSYVEKNCLEWGVHVEQIILKDMRMSPLLSENLSVVSKTRRQVEANIISAKADLECAKLYREASDIMEMKAAIQIRFLETLENMNHMPSRKATIIPLKQQFEDFPQTG